VVVPAFTADGVLPPGRHAATIEEIEDALVRRFGAGSLRRLLFQGWAARHRALRQLLPVIEWVDGSFVEAKQTPRDVDVVTFLPDDAVARLSSADLRHLERLFEREHNRQRFHCDVYGVAEYGGGDPRYGAFEAARRYWDRQWSHRRDGLEKGYLEVR
jgi:hypothetical protein